MAAAWPSGDQERFATLTDGLNVKLSSTCEPGDNPGTVECVENVVRHDLYGPAGVLGDLEVRFRVDGGVITGFETISEPSENAAFELAFAEWLAANRPDLTASFVPGDDPPIGSADDAAAILIVLQDFLDESDEYPISG